MVMISLCKQSFAVEITKQDVFSNLLGQSLLDEIRTNGYELSVNDMPETNEGEVIFSKNGSELFRYKLVFGDDYIAMGMTEELYENRYDIYASRVLLAIGEYFLNITGQDEGLTTDQKGLKVFNTAIAAKANDQDPENAIFLLCPSFLGVNVALSGQNSTDAYSVKTRRLAEELLDEELNAQPENTVNNAAQNTANNVENKVVTNTVKNNVVNSTGSYKREKIPAAGIDMGIIKVCLGIIAASILIMIMYK